MRKLAIGAVLPAPTGADNFRSVTQDESGVMWITTSREIFRKQTNPGPIERVTLAGVRLRGAALVGRYKRRRHWLADRKGAFLYRDGRAVRKVVTNFSSISTDGG